MLVLYILIFKLSGRQKILDQLVTGIPCI